MKIYASNKHVGSVYLVKKIDKDFIWHENIYYYIDQNSDYVFEAYVYLNCDKQNKFHWKYFATDNENEFSDKK